MSDKFWQKLRDKTKARVGLQRIGAAISTKDQLQFQWAQARAHDAVHLPWDFKKLQKSLQKLKIANLIAHSQVESREQYLLRPDLARELHLTSRQKIKTKAVKKAASVAIVLSNGLSSLAFERHGLNLLKKILKSLKDENFYIHPIVIVPDSRVALADSVGEIYKADISLILIGERPGLSAVDSLAIYLTYKPRAGKTNAERNCISNIRPPDGLDYQTAADKCLYLCLEMLDRKLSGFQLKDESDELLLNHRNDYLGHGPSGSKG